MDMTEDDYLRIVEYHKWAQQVVDEESERDELEHLADPRSHGPDQE